MLWSCVRLQAALYEREAQSAALDAVCLEHQAAGTGLQP